MVEDKILEWLKKHQDNMINAAVAILTFNNAMSFSTCLEYCSKFKPEPKWWIILENNSVDGTRGLILDWIREHPNTIVLEYWFIEDAIAKYNDGPFAIVGTLRQIMLQKARKLNVDWLVFLDDDIYVANKDFLNRITKPNKDIVGGAYLRSYVEGDFLSYLGYNKEPNKDKLPYVLRGQQKHKFMRAAAVGGGCMCIGNKLMNDPRVHFYPLQDYFRTGKVGEDFGYCEMARRNGYNCYVDDRFWICHNQTHPHRPWTFNTKDKKFIEWKYPKSQHW